MTFSFWPPGPHDRSWSRAVLFVPLWLTIAVIPALIAWIAGAALGASMEDAFTFMQGALAWDELFANRLRQGATWGDGLGFVAAQAPAFLLKCVLLASLLVTVRWMYRRPARSWITRAPRFRWRHYALGLLVIGMAFSAILATWGVLSQAADYEPRPPDGGAGVIIITSAALMLIVAVNAFGEEVLFRGWLMQQTAAFTRSPFIIFGLSAAVFALAHFELHPPRMAQLLIMGFAFGWAAWRLGGLELAAGAHAGANVAIDMFQPIGRASSAETENYVRALGVAAEQAERISIQAPPTLMDWIVFTTLALLPALLAETIYRWGNAARG